MSSAADQERSSDQVGDDHHDPLFSLSCIDSWRMFLGRHSLDDGKRVVPTPELMGLLEEFNELEQCRGKGDGGITDEGSGSDSGYVDLQYNSPNADWMQRGWVNWAVHSGFPFNQVVAARGWNEGWGEEEEEGAEDPTGLRKVGQLHARIRMVRSEEEEEEEERGASGSRDPQPVQGPDGGPVLARRIFESFSSFLGRRKK